jgi:hypothetical protein
MLVYSSFFFLSAHSITLHSTVSIKMIGRMSRKSKMQNKKKKKTNGTNVCMLEAKIRLNSRTIS